MAAPAPAPFRSAFEGSPPNRGHTLQDVIASLARAADQGQDTLFSEARILFRTALSAADARILTRSAGMWREWNKIEAEDCLDANVAVLVETLQPSDAPVRSGRFLVAPVSGSSVAVVIEIDGAAETPPAICNAFVTCSTWLWDPARAGMGIRTNSKRSRYFNELPTRF